MKKVSKTKMFLKKELAKEINLHNLLIPVLVFLIGCSLFPLVNAANTCGLLGDVNCNGMINSTDALSIASHASWRKQLSTEAQKYADTNGDWEISSLDACLAQAAFVGLIKLPTTTVPVRCASSSAKGYNWATKQLNWWNSSTSSQKTIVSKIKTASTAALWDVSGEGIINSIDWLMIQKYIFSMISLTPSQLTRADVDQDWKVTYRDSRIILAYFGNKISSLPYKWTSYPLEKYWDANISDDVNATDALVVLKHVAKNPLISSNSLWYCMADVNADNNITNKDAEIIWNNFVGTINTSPYIEDIILWDVNLDWAVNANDTLVLGKCNIKPLSYRQRLASDVDQDWISWPKDSYFILKKFTNWISSFPVRWTDLEIPAWTQLPSFQDCKWTNAQCSRFITNAIPSSVATKK